VDQLGGFTPDIFKLRRNGGIPKFAVAAPISDPSFVSIFLSRTTGCSVLFWPRGQYSAAALTSLGESRKRSTVGLQQKKKIDTNNFCCASRAGSWEECL